MEIYLGILQHFYLLDVFLDVFAKTHNVRWENEFVECNRIPFLSLSNCTMECVYGKWKYRPLSKKEKKAIGNNRVSRNVKEPSQKTIKQGCPAKVKLYEVVSFPDYIIQKDNAYHRGMMAKKLKRALHGKDVATIGKIERTILVCIPDIAVHICERHFIPKVCLSQFDYI